MLEHISLDGVIQATGLSPRSGLKYVIHQVNTKNHAVQLASQLPGFKYGLGPVELRPVADISEMMKESEQRRQRKDNSRGVRPRGELDDGNREWSAHQCHYLKITNFVTG